MAQHVASQKKMCTVGTQLSMESRQYKSTGLLLQILYSVKFFGIISNTSIY